jgi:hypothetical protein
MYINYCIHIYTYILFTYMHTYIRLLLMRQGVCKLGDILIESAGSCDAHDDIDEGSEELQALLTHWRRVVSRLSGDSLRSVWLMALQLQELEDSHQWVFCVYAPGCRLPLVLTLIDVLTSDAPPNEPERCVLCSSAVFFDSTNPLHSRCCGCGELLDRCCVSLRLVLSSDFQDITSDTTIVRCTVCECYGLRKAAKGSDESDDIIVAQSWLWWHDLAPLCPFCMILMQPLY